MVHHCKPLGCIRAAFAHHPCEGPSVTTRRGSLSIPAAIRQHRYSLLLISGHICVDAVQGGLVAGIGIAMLHPEGGRLANLVAPGDKAASMSIFSVGGQVGFCVGPIITCAAMSAFGLRDSAAVAQAGGRGRWDAFGVVLGALSARSIICYGVTSFVPLFMVAVFAQSEQAGSAMITLFAAVEAAATLASSKAAGRVGTRRLIVGCFVALVAGLAAFASSPSVTVSIGLIVVLAIAINLFNPPAITLGQSFVPNHLSMASGLSFGVVVCVGGVLSPVLGLFGDAFGLIAVMWALSAIAAVGLALALRILHL